MNNYDRQNHGYRGIFDVKFSELIGGSGTTKNQCIGYVVEQFMQLLKQYSENIFLFSCIENLPDNILDYLAIEWDLPYYEDSLDRDTKVRLIKEGYNWRRTAGTVYGVETLVKKMFGEGKVLEWYDIGGDPGTFRIQTNAPMTPNMEEFFRVLLAKEKKASSHLVYVDVIRDLIMTYYIGAAIHTRYTCHRHTPVTE